MQKFKIHNQKGFGHVELVLAVLFIGLFAFVGIRVMGINQAATLAPLSKVECTTMGRTWNTTSSTCNKVCATGQGTYIATTTYAYCSGALTPASKIAKSTCSRLGRVALPYASYVGCARRADQKTTIGPVPQCITQNSYVKYTVMSTLDTCGIPIGTVLKAPATIANSITCSYSISPLVGRGVTSQYTLSIRNNSSYTYTFSTYVNFALQATGASSKTFNIHDSAVLIPGSAKTFSKSITTPATAYDIAIGNNGSLVGTAKIDASCYPAGYVY